MLRTRRGIGTNERRTGNNSPARHQTAGDGSDGFTRPTGADAFIDEAVANEDAHAKQLFEQLVQQEMRRMKQRLAPTSPNADAEYLRRSSPQSWRDGKLDTTSSISPTPGPNPANVFDGRESERELPGTFKQDNDANDDADWRSSTQRAGAAMELSGEVNGVDYQNVMDRANGPTSGAYSSGKSIQNGGVGDLGGDRGSGGGGGASGWVSEAENVGFGRGLKTLNSAEALKAKQEKYERVTTFRRDLDEQRQHKRQQQLDNEQRDARERQERLRFIGDGGSGGGQGGGGTVSYQTATPAFPEVQAKYAAELGSGRSWAVSGRSPERGYVSPTRQAGGGATIGGAFPIGMEPMEAREQQRRKQQQYALELENQMRDVKLRKQQEKLKEQEWEVRQTKKLAQLKQQESLQHESVRREENMAAVGTAAMANHQFKSDSPSLLVDGLGFQEQHNHQHHHQQLQDGFPTSPSSLSSPNARGDQGLGTGGRRGPGAMIQQQNVGQSVVHPGREEEHMIKQKQQAQQRMVLQLQIQEKKDRDEKEKLRLAEIERAEEERITRDLHQLRVQEQASQHAFVMQQDPGLLVGHAGPPVAAALSPVPFQTNNPVKTSLHSPVGFVSPTSAQGSIAAVSRHQSPTMVTADRARSPVRPTYHDLLSRSPRAGGRSPAAMSFGAHAHAYETSRGLGHIEPEQQEGGQNGVVQSHQLELLQMHDEQRRLHQQMERQRQQIDALKQLQQHQSRQPNTLQQQHHHHQQSIQSQLYHVTESSGGGVREHHHPHHQAAMINNDDHEKQRFDHITNSRGAGAMPPSPPTMNRIPNFNDDFNNNNNIHVADDEVDDDDSDRANYSIFEQSLHSHSKFIAADSNPAEGTTSGSIRGGEDDVNVLNGGSLPASGTGGGDGGDGIHAGGHARMSTSELEGDDVVAVADDDDDDDDDDALPVACEYLVFVGNAEEEHEEDGNIVRITTNDANDFVSHGISDKDYNDDDDDNISRGVRHGYGGEQFASEHGHEQNGRTSGGLVSESSPLWNSTKDFHFGTEPGQHVRVATSGSSFNNIELHESELDQSRAQTAQAAMMALQRASTHSDDEDSPRWGLGDDSGSDFDGASKTGHGRGGSKLRPQTTPHGSGIEVARLGAGGADDNYALHDDGSDGGGDEDSYEEDFHDDEEGGGGDNEMNNNGSAGNKRHGGRERSIKKLAVGDEWSGVREVAASSNGGGRGWTEDKSFWEGGKVRRTDDESAPALWGIKNEKDSGDDDDDRVMRRSVASSVMTSSKHSLFPVHSRKGSTKGAGIASSNVSHKEGRDGPGMVLKGRSEVVVVADDQSRQKPQMHRQRARWSQMSGGISQGGRSVQHGDDEGQGHIGDDLSGDEGL